MSRIQTGTFDLALSGLAREAVATLGVSESFAREAAATTRRNLHMPDVLTAYELRRVQAYYRAVVRRRCLRARGPEFAVPGARIVLSAIRCDLRDAGWDEHAIEKEIATHYTDLVDRAGLTQAAMPAA